MAGIAWSPVFTDSYTSLEAGSIDRTDTEPHDRAVVRGMNATYKPNKQVSGDSKCILFVGMLNHSTTENTLEKTFSYYGDIKSLRIIRDIVTGFSKGYAFVEYEFERQALRAWSGSHKRLIDGKEILVEFEFERKLRGWVPRRLGGGLGGKKESGQLRFGCRERPFIKPITNVLKKEPVDSDNYGYSGDNKERERAMDSDSWRQRERSRDWSRHRNTERPRQKDSEWDRHKQSSRSRRRSRSRSRNRKRSRSRSRSRRHRSGSRSRRKRSSSKSRRPTSPDRKPEMSGVLQDGKGEASPD